MWIAVPIQPMILVDSITNPTYDTCGKEYPPPNTYPYKPSALILYLDCLRVMVVITIQYLGYCRIQRPGAFWHLYIYWSALTLSQPQQNAGQRTFSFKDVH
jgi:hypothetical protein